MKRTFAAAAASLVLPAALLLPMPSASATGSALAVDTVGSDGPSVGHDADVRASLGEAAKHTEAYRIAQSQDRDASVQAQADEDPAVAGATIVSPATGTDVAGDFEVAVSRGSAINLTLWLDGQYYAADSGTAASVVFPLSLEGPTGGQSHTIAVGDCAAALCAAPGDGTVSQSITVTAYPSAGVDVTSASSSGYLSPDSDGVKDTVAVQYATQVAGTVKATVTRLSDSTVVRTVTIGSKAPGSSSFVWNGMSDAGAVAANGGYRVTISVTTSGGSTSSDGVNVVLDTQDPSLSSLKRSDFKVFPRKDKYRDWVTFSANLSERASLVRLKITNAKGKTVRTLSATSVSGTVKLKWSGRTASGNLLPAGTYKYRWTATDLSGNTKTTSAGSIGVDNRILKAKVRTKTVTPSKSRVGGFTGSCSRVKVNPNDWSGGRGYWSMWKLFNGKSCDDSEDYTDLVAGEYKLTVPKAVKYGTVRVGALGKAHVITYKGQTFKKSTGALALFKNDVDDPIASAKTLGSSYKTRWTGSRSFSSLGFGRTVRWMAGTSDYYYYDVRSFKVKWSYYVLVK